MGTGSKTNRWLSSGGKNNYVLDEAWDVFVDYMGRNGIINPLTQNQFEEILLIVDQDSKFIKFKDEILYSFQYDSYAWPLVEKRK